MLSPRINTGQTAQSSVVPAPVGGLNGRDPIASMEPKDAYMMDNAFPSTAYVVSRKGCVSFCALGVGYPVQSLEVYTGAAGDKMLAFGGGSIFDASGAVPVSLASGMTSNLVVTAMYSNSADTAQRLIIVSGSDTPRAFDGTVISELVITGAKVGPERLNTVFTFKSRLYFGEENRLGFYYLPVGQIQGALSYFDLGQVSRLGGKLVAIASYSDESGVTPDDYIVFLTNKGEAIVYAGFDPSNVASWALVGRFYSAPPIGKKCTLNFGAELVFITLDGLISFSQVRKSGNYRTRGVQGSEYSSLTAKLGSYLTMYKGFADTPGWSGVQYSGSTDGWLLLNVPTTKGQSGEYVQYVMNTNTNAWCRFTNWNATCFAVYNRRLYFGRWDGNIFLGDESTSDNGGAIPYIVKQAYNYFEDGDGLGFLTKHFLWASLLVSSDAPVPISGAFNVDYYETKPDQVVSIISGGSKWDVTKWDEGLWGQEDNTQRVLITLNRAGVAGSLWITSSLNRQQFKWFGTQYVMQKTKGLLL